MTATVSQTIMKGTLASRNLGTFMLLGVKGWGRREVSVGSHLGSQPWNVRNREKEESD